MSFRQRLATPPKWWCALPVGQTFLSIPKSSWLLSHFPIVLPALNTYWAIGLCPSFSRWGGMSSKWDIIIIQIPRPVQLLAWGSWEFLHTSSPSQPETLLDFTGASLLALPYCHHQVPEKVMVISCAGLVVTVEDSVVAMEGLVLPQFTVWLKVGCFLPHSLTELIFLFFVVEV